MPQVIDVSGLEMSLAEPSKNSAVILSTDTTAAIVLSMQYRVHDCTELLENVSLTSNGCICVHIDELIIQTLVALYQLIQNNSTVYFDCFDSVNISAKDGIISQDPMLDSRSELYSEECTQGEVLTTETYDFVREDGCSIGRLDMTKEKVFYNRFYSFTFHPVYN
jgi:hypothetical protein